MQNGISGERHAARLLVCVLILFIHVPSGHAAAGRTPGSFVVSPTGAATYTIPIWAPPGPHGLQPHIALVYNSQSGNGPEGIGWTLSGLSSIYRCNQTAAQDTTPAPVALATTDGYCMDGKRLRLSGGTYGTAGSTYQTEIADFSNVTANGTAGQGPATFTVKTQDGLTQEYGNGGYSQIMANGTAAAWLLDKVTDSAGNSMTIAYTSPNSNLVGATVPATISWTATAHQSSTYNYTMQFNYTTIPLPHRAGYVAGSPVANDYLLNSVVISSAGATVKKYGLGYLASSTTARETLTTVLECADSAQTNCLAPTNITYQPGQVGVSSTSSTLAYAPSPYDFNGDGRPDAYYQSGGILYVALNTGSGFGTPINTGASATGAIIGDVLGTGSDGILATNGSTYYYYQYSASTGTFSGINTNAPVSANYSYVLADITGDGLPDLVGTYSNALAMVTIPNTSAGGAPSFGSPYAFNLPVPNPPSGTAIRTNLMSSAGESAQAIRSFDFNGDGRKDLALQVHRFHSIGGGDVNDAYNYFQLISQGANAPFQVVHLPFDPTVNPPAVFGNFNDDNCTDVALATTVYYSGCNGTIASTLTLPDSVTVIAAIDWDGDGRTDILTGTAGSTLSWYPSTGTGFGSLQATSVTIPSGCVDPSVVDVDADGLDDFGCNTGTSFQYFSHNQAGNPPDLLSQVQDGYGNSVSPSYVSLSQTTNIHYFTANDAAYPYQNYRGPLYVVSGAAFSDPSATGTTYQQTYYYGSAWTNLQGRGFAGFGNVQLQDSRNGVWRTWGYGRCFPYTGMYAGEVATQNNTASQTLWTVGVTFDSTAPCAVPFSQQYFPHASNVTRQDYELGSSQNRVVTTTSRDFSYDSYGNATEIKTTITDNDSGSPYQGQSWTTDVVNTTDISANPTADLAAWCLTQLDETQTTYSTTPATSTVVRTQTYTPDTPGACRIKTIVTEPTANGGIYSVTETFGYDSFGNVNSDSVTGANMTPRSTSIDWGTTGQFPMSVTDPSGAQTTFDYNFSYGLRNRVTDANGLTTSWQYGDGFGRVTQQNKPDGTAVSLTYNACAPPNTCDPLWRSFVWTSLLDQKGSTITKSVTTYDAVDRPIELSALSLTGSWSTVITNYDPLGHVASRTEPFFFGATQYAETYLYDVLNRLTSSQRPVSGANTSLQKTTYQYQGDLVTLTDANQHAKTLIRDPNRWLRQTQDATGYAVTLGYDPAGSQTSVTDSLGNTLWSGTVQYGIRPFTVNATDADLGPWSYTYDALGELTAWMDAKSQSFSAQYDALSRMTDRYEPDLYTHWTWGTSKAADEIGQLHSVCTGTGLNPTTCTAAPGYAESETYDTAGRLSQRSIQIPDEGTYAYGWSYNATTGLLDTLTYPTVNSYALAIQYAYQNGLLQSLTDISDTPHVPLWTANATNPAGVPTQESLGNGVIVNHTLDAVTGRVSNITAGLNGGVALQNNSYLFDEVGNLIQRQDNNARVTENAFPDVLDRLDHTVGDANTNLTYDTMGRLATMEAYGNSTNVKDYTTPQTGCTYYTNTQPHALRKNTQGSGPPASFCYDGNGNMTQEIYNGSAVFSSTWTSYNQPLSMTGSPSSSRFFYDHNHQRFKQVASYSGSPETTIYIGGLLEKMTNSSGTAYRHYIPAGNNSIVYNRWSTGSNPIYYMTHDHLGSTAVITDQSGALVVSEQFAALGWNENTSAQETTMGTITRHEFTGHEGLDNAGLWMVNMNGRVYTPSGSMFLSPDPTIPDPTNTLSYNRYAYANYNPLTLTDPSGFDACFPTYSNINYSGIDSDGVPYVGFYTAADGGQNCIPEPSVSVQNFGSGSGGGGFQMAIETLLRQVDVELSRLQISQPQGNQQCLKSFLNTTPVDAPPRVLSPLAVLGTVLGALLSGDTPESQRPRIYYHYGYASQAGLFAGGIRPGGYGTPDLVILSGSSAQQIYALPPQNSIDSPPNARYTVTVPPGVPVQNLGPVGPTTFPGPVNPTGDDVTRTGGGNEVLFPKGTPPGSVSAPQSLPPC